MNTKAINLIRRLTAKGVDVTPSYLYLYYGIDREQSTKIINELKKRKLYDRT